MTELIQYVPFDESSGTIAKDLSGNDFDFTTDGSFVKGRKENALNVSGDELCEIIGNSVVDFSQDFTYTFWFNLEKVGSFWVLFKFSGIDQYIMLDGKEVSEWTYLSILKYSDKASIYCNGALLQTEDFPDGWGQPTGFVILNDSEGSVAIDELKVWSGINLDAIKPPYLPMNVQYKISYQDFKDFGVRVKQGDGLFDALKMKEPFKVDWPDYHGEVLDLDNVRYEARQITLDCFIHASTKEDFEQKVKDFLDLFYGSGTKRLSIEASGTMYVYEVYLGSGAQVKKRWRSADMVGEFQLVMTEPQPIKRTIFFARSSGNTTASVTLTSSKPLTIYWGDGAISENVYGNAINKTHTYSADGQYYIIVAGVIEEVSGLSTNGILKNGANSYF